MQGFESHIAGNKTKTVLIMLGFFAGVVALGYFAGFLVEPMIADIILVGAVFLAIFSTGMSYWYADSVITKMVDARPANPNVYIEKYYIDTVEGLVLAAGLPAIPKAYVIESDALNAFATGRDPEHSLIGVTTGLLNTLDRQELEGVIAHEMSHIYNRDTLLMMVAAILVGGIALFSHSIMRILFYGGGSGGRRSRDNDSGGGAGAILIVVALVFMILAPIFANMLNLFLSRKREFLADATAVSLARNPDGLISALKKISANHQPMPFVEKELSALFIDNPLHAAHGETSSVFSTHPPMSARIRALESM
ncbi:MAG: M48 family metallopeptidase [bacterium]|nr:M48 family metallopeptidase [bacterium]